MLRIPSRSSEISAGTDRALHASAFDSHGWPFSGIFSTDINCSVSSFPCWFGFAVGRYAVAETVGCEANSAVFF